MKISLLLFVALCISGASAAATWFHISDIFFGVLSKRGMVSSGVSFISFLLFHPCFLLFHPCFLLFHPCFLLFHPCFLLFHSCFLFHHFFTLFFFFSSPWSLWYITSWELSWCLLLFCILFVCVCVCARACMRASEQKKESMNERVSKWSPALDFDEPLYFVAKFYMLFLYSSVCWSRVCSAVCTALPLCSLVVGGCFTNLCAECLFVWLDWLDGARHWSSWTHKLPDDLYHWDVFLNKSTVLLSD